MATTVINNDQTGEFAPSAIGRPNRRLNRGNTSSSTLGSSLGSSLNSSMMSMSLASSSSTTAAQRRPSFGSSLRDRRGLSESTGGNVGISFTQDGGLDASTLAEILSGLDSDDEDNASAGSDVPEMKMKPKRRCSGRSVKWEDEDDTPVGKLETIESEKSLHMSAGSVDVDLSDV